MSDIVFCTERLLVRRLRDSDLMALSAVYGDKEAMTWVGDGQPLDLEQCAHWLDITRRNYQVYGYGMFAVEQLATSVVIGFCGIVHPQEVAVPEIKYAYLRTFWGQGYATEAAIGLLRYGTAAHGLKHIVATVAPANTSSHQVLQKSGMRRGEPKIEKDGSETLVFHWTEMTRN